MPVNIIDTLKPKNGGSFPIVEAIDVFVENYGNLAEAVSHFATDVMIEAINTVLSGKANTSDVNTAVANLQNQINQIEISASAESVVAPEVAAARVGNDGTSYQTLKSRLDAENSELESQLSLQMELISSSHIVDTAWSNKSVNSDGSQSTSTDYTRASNDELVFVPKGCKATITLSAGYSSGLYYFDENKSYVSSSFSSHEVDGDTYSFFRLLIANNNGVNISEIDTICTIEIVLKNAVSHFIPDTEQLDAVNSGINSAKTAQIDTNTEQIEEIKFELDLTKGPVTVNPAWSNRQVNQDGSQGLTNSKRASTDNLIYVPQDCIATLTIASNYSGGVYYFDEDKEYTGSSFSNFTVIGNDHPYFRVLIGSASDIDASQANTICRITISKAVKSVETAQSIFSTIVGDSTQKIVLLGDSITQGTGSTGYIIYSKEIDGVTYSIRGNGPDYPEAGAEYQIGDYIYGDSSRKWYEALDGAGWAQIFKEYLEGKFGCTVKNYGCAGANASDLLAAIQASVIGQGFNIAVVMIGTNNRQDSTLESYYNDLSGIINALKGDGVKVIVMGGIPASVSNETNFSHHMEDINHLALKCAVEANVPFISMYSCFSDYCEFTSHTIDDYLGDGLHPNDSGYSIMFRLLCKEVGIVPKRLGATW